MQPERDTRRGCDSVSKACVGGNSTLVGKEGEDGTGGANDGTKANVVKVVKVVASAAFGNHERAKQGQPWEASAQQKPSQHVNGPRCQQGSQLCMRYGLYLLCAATTTATATRHEAVVHACTVLGAATAACVVAAHVAGAAMRGWRRC